MEKLNLPFFYQIGHELHRLASIRMDAPVQELFMACGSLRPVLESLLNGLPSLKVAKPAGEELKKLMDGLFHDPDQKKFGHIDFTKPLDGNNYQLQAVMFSISRQASEFQTVLNAELQSLAAYLVTQTGIYSGAALVEHAEDVVPVKLKAKLSPIALEDIRQSGRCLAFGVGTACGFHILRATEAAMHQYYVKVCNQGSNCDPLDNWGAYIASFRKQSDSDTKRIVELLQQVKDHDRNFIMHPEVFLNDDDAHTLFEFAKGAIMAMAEKL